MFYFRRLSWALRKTMLPIPSNALVLDVGSGGNPYPRSDILLDRLTGAEHRGGSPMMIDRIAVFGNATKLPFKDGAFDYVIASHILEHIEDPEIFIKELQRVGKAGYIETPNFLFERLIPYNIHCLEVASVGGVLHIHKKKSAVEDYFLSEINFLKKDKKWNQLFYSSPDLFHVRYFWKNKINYKIHNPNTSSKWIEEIYEKSTSNDTSRSYKKSIMGWREYGLYLLGLYHKHLRSKRMRDFNILNILACPECKGKLDDCDDKLFCGVCNIEYSKIPYLNLEV